jgi:hypothetical protein
VPFRDGEQLYPIEAIAVDGVQKRAITMEFQRRYHYDDMEKIGDFDPTYHTAVCDAVPDLRFSLQYDWDKKEIPQFEYYMDKIRARLAQKR